MTSPRRARGRGPPSAAARASLLSSEERAPPAGSGRQPRRDPHGPARRGARSRSQTGRSSQPELPVLGSYQRFPLETAFARGDAPCPSQPCRATGVTAPCAALRTREALRRAAAPPSPAGGGAGGHPACIVRVPGSDGKIIRSSRQTPSS